MPSGVVDRRLRLDLPTSTNQVFTHPSDVRFVRNIVGDLGDEDADVDRIDRTGKVDRIDRKRKAGDEIVSKNGDLVVGQLSPEQGHQRDVVLLRHTVRIPGTQPAEYRSQKWWKTQRIELQWLSRSARGHPAAARTEAPRAMSSSEGVWLVRSAI